MIRALAVAVAFAAIVGCSGGENGRNASNPTNESDAIQLNSTLDPAKAAPASSEELPLPATAVPHATVHDAWSVPNATYDELVAWYRTQLPEGRDWRDWAWCELKMFEDGDRTTQWLWSMPPNRILSVLVVEDDPPGVLIGPPDDSGPC